MSPNTKVLSRGVCEYLRRERDAGAYVHAVPCFSANIFSRCNKGGIHRKRIARVREKVAEECGTRGWTYGGVSCVGIEQLEPLEAALQVSDTPRHTPSHFDSARKRHRKAVEFMRRITTERNIRLRIVAREFRKLQAAGVPFTKSQSGRPAIFFRDPDANTVEVGQALGWKDGAAP